MSKNYRDLKKRKKGEKKEKKKEKKMEKKEKTKKKSYPFSDVIWESSRIRESKDIIKSSF